MSQKRITHLFLCLATLVAGPLAGAKLFDLVVLAGAWSADPPHSLSMMPYGKAWPVDTGLFFIPFSTVLLISAFGALVSGWKTPWRYRWLLCVPSIGILALLILTVTEFWPMNAALYHHGVHSPKDTITDAQSVAMARRWIALNWAREIGSLAAFASALRALVVPWSTEISTPDPPVVRALLFPLLAGVAGFVVYFVLNI